MKHRGMTAYCSAAEINLTYAGWAGSSSAILSYIRAHPDGFVEKLDLMSQPVSRIERIATQAQPKGILHSIKRLGDLNPDVENAEVQIHCYSRWDGYRDVLDGIRTELLKHLVRLLGSV
jgi:hypothetical protein